MTDRFLLEKSIRSLISDWYPDWFFEEEEFTIEGGSRNVKFYTLKFIEDDQVVESISFFYIHELIEGSQGRIREVMNSEDYASAITVILFKENRFDANFCRFLISQVKRKWIPFCLGDAVFTQKFFDKTLRQVQSSSYGDIFELRHCIHLSRGLQRIIQKINKLYTLEFWEEVLINLRKLVENAIHIWWRINHNNQDSELRDHDGPIALIGRLEKVQGEGTLTEPRVRSIEAVKGMGDLSVHDMRFHAREPDARYGVTHVKSFLNDLFQPPEVN